MKDREVALRRRYLDLIALLVIQIDKLRFKINKGDPKGFVIFLETNGLPRGLPPCYRGNRLHIYFHIYGILFQHHSFLLKSCSRRGPLVVDCSQVLQQTFAMKLHMLKCKWLACWGNC